MPLLVNGGLGTVEEGKRVHGVIVPEEGPEGSVDGATPKDANKFRHLSVQVIGELFDVIVKEEEPSQ